MLLLLASIRPTTSYAARGPSAPKSQPTDQIWPSKVPVDIDLRRCIHFINLTNGVQALPTLRRLNLAPRVTRIQSTHCEQQQLEQLCLGLGPDLLLHLATAHTCLIWDLGSRNKKRAVPRALWYGLEFVRFTLALAWFDQELPAYLRGQTVTHTFHQHYRNFAPSTRRLLRYYRKYVTSPAPNAPLVQLYGVYKATQHDGDDELHKQLAAALLTAPTDAAPGSLEPLPATALAEHGYALFGGGIGHAELRSMQREATSQ